MVGRSPRCYCSFAYSALASFRMGMSRCSLRQAHPAQQIGVSRIGPDAVKDWIDHDWRELIISHLISLL